MTRTHDLDLVHPPLGSWGSLVAECSCGGWSGRFPANASPRAHEAWKAHVEAETESQPAPKRTTEADGPSVQDRVIADIEERKRVGMERYGTLLRPRNGRDMLRDAYEEALDLAIYLRGALDERD